MRGKKAKALRAMVGFAPTRDRSDAPGEINDFTPFENEKGQLVRNKGVTVGLNKEHPRHAYQFVKERYGNLPLAQMLGKLKTGLPEVKEKDHG
jgi:hypothetical protein